MKPCPEVDCDMLGDECPTCVGRGLVENRGEELAVAVLDYLRCLEDHSFWTGTHEDRQMIRSRLDDLYATMRLLAEELA